jgi:hypothetical protein
MLLQTSNQTSTAIRKEASLGSRTTWVGRNATLSLLYLYLHELLHPQETCCLPIWLLLRLLLLDRGQENGLIGGIFQKHAHGPFLLQKLKVLVVLFLLHHIQLAVEQLQGGGSARWEGFELGIVVDAAVTKLLSDLLPNGLHESGCGSHLLYLSHDWFWSNHRSRLELTLGHCRHGKLGTSVLAEHLSGKLRFVPKEELVVVHTKFRAARYTNKIPVKKMKPKVKKVSVMTRVAPAVSARFERKF